MVDKPRALQHKGNLEKSRIILISKRKEWGNAEKNIPGTRFDKKRTPDY